MRTVLKSVWVVYKFALVDGGLHTTNSASFDVSEDFANIPKDKLTWIQCPVVSLDEWCAKHQFSPDVLKIDVEGFEFEVLKGATQVLDTSRPLIVIGIHPFWWPKAQSPQAIHEFLKETRYVCLNLQGHRSEPNEFADYVLVPQEKESSWNSMAPTRSKA